MDIKILVVAHKPYRMPQDPIYFPIQVGNGSDMPGFQRDNVGENIAEMNPRFDEGTALYWAWKNLNADYIGLAHYRRHFTNASFFRRMTAADKFSLTLREDELRQALTNTDVIVPNKRKYYIETMESHFLHMPYVHEKDYRVLRKTIAELSPEYLSAYDLVMKRTWAHMFTMFIMKRELLDQYCAWMFPIMFACDCQIDVTGYSRMEARAVGYFREFMLDIWLEKNRIPYKEIPVMFMEKQNWLKKGGAFLVRKLRAKTR